MFKKNYSKTGRACRVTFKVPAEIEAETIALLGDFNAWDADSTPLTARKDGSHSTTISLAAGQDYRFRYLIDSDRWINDEAPDREVANRFGGLDCVISV